MDFLKFAGLVALIVFSIVAGPLITIWAVNTLFGLGIAYTFWTWLAMLCIHLIVRGGVKLKL
jgi:hypothetical protein